MKLHINGDEKTFDSPLTLKALLETLGLKADRIAVELNRELVPRDRWPETQLHEGDQLEVVHFVGGGWGPGMPSGLPCRNSVTTRAFRRFPHRPSG